MVELLQIGTDRALQVRRLSEELTRASVVQHRGQLIALHKTDDLLLRVSQSEVRIDVRFLQLRQQRRHVLLRVVFGGRFSFAQLSLFDAGAPEQGLVVLPLLLELGQELLLQLPKDDVDALDLSLEALRCGLEVDRRLRELECDPIRVLRQLHVVAVTRVRDRVRLLPELVDDEGQGLAELLGRLEFSTDALDLLFELFLQRLRVG